MRLAAVRLHVHRLDRALEFYGQRLGLPLKVDGRPLGWCVFALDGVDLVVEAVASDAPEDEQALVGRPTGLSLAVADVRAEQDRLAARGVPFVGAPELQAWGGWLGTFEDPDGNQLQLVQYPAPR
jgi:predicted enzyme related to lactoylglutathione lyase